MSAPTPEPAPLDLDALERLLTRATDGPWRVVQDDSESITTVWQVCTSPEHPTEDDPERIGVYDCCADGGLHSEPWYREADAELVAAARNALPELIRRARERDYFAQLNEVQAIRIEEAWARAARSRAELDQWRAAYGESALPGALNLMKQRTRERDAALAEVGRLRPVVDAARELLRTDSEGGESVMHDWAHRQLADAVDALDADAPVEPARCTCDHVADPPTPHRAWCATRHQHPGPDCAGLCEPARNTQEPCDTCSGAGCAECEPLPERTDRWLATWSITGSVERVVEQARIALAQMASEYADAGPVKLRAELRADGGDPR